MRDSINEMPRFWVDHNGVYWKVPTIIGRLKSRIPCHRALREYVIHRDGYKCMICSSTENLVADHILSRRNGGEHHPDNMQCLCQSCNCRKAGLVDAKFKKLEVRNGAR